MTRSISHNFFYQHPPEVVWEFLTKSELIAQWLMKNDFEPIVGHDFQFRINPMPDFNFDGIVYCKVLEIVPLKKLVYSWKSGRGDGRMRVDSIVEWRLHAKNGGTELFLKHSGFMEDTNIYSILNEGWLKNMHKISDLLNTPKHDNTNT